MTPVTDIERPSGGRCVQCDVPVKDLTAPCWSCGRVSVGDTQTPPTAPAWPSPEPVAGPSPVPGSASPWVVGGAVVIGLAVVLIAAFLVLGNTKKSPVEELETADEQAAPITPSSLSEVPPIPTSGVTPASPPAGMMAAPTGPETVDRAQAEAVFAAMWPVRERALAEHDADLAAGLLEGPLRDGVVHDLQCGCNKPFTARPFPTERRFFIPRQLAYPASFVVEAVVADSKPALATFGFRRRDAGSPWKLVTFASTEQADVGALESPIDDHGFDAAPPETQPAVKAFADYARAFDGAAHRQVTAEEARFSAGFDGKQAFDGVRNEEYSGIRAPNGLLQRESFSALPGAPLIEVAVAPGRRLACSFILKVIEWYDENGGGPFQPPDRHNWGATIEPGTYTAVRSTSPVQACMVIDPDPEVPIEVRGTFAREASIVGLR
jgi:hypothetical protein